MADQTTKIAVFAGHGGSDPGAVSGGRKEKDYTLLAANALAKRLKSLGYSVVQNRTTDADSGITVKCAQANNAGVAAVCELHLNSGGGVGSEVWYADGEKKSIAFAQKAVEALAALGYQNRGVKNDKTCRFGSFGILRGTNAPAVLAELCFIDNAADMARFDADKIAAALAGAISAFCPLTGTPAPEPPANTTQPPATPAKTVLAVGDKVTITGAYASSASASSAPHTAAVGRTVVIGKVYASSKYPYRLDSADGTGLSGGTAIGFANASSLKKAAESSSGSTAAQAQSYTVVSGDSLWGIAQKLLGNGARYPEIAKLNGLTEKSVILPGQKLKVPAK